MKNILLESLGKAANFFIEDDKDVVNISRQMCNFVLRKSCVGCQVTPEYLTDAQGSTICVVKSLQSDYITLHLNDNLQ